MRIKDFCLLFLFIFLFNYTLLAENDSLVNSSNKNFTTYTSHDIRAGERIFHGLVPGATKTVNCASCHNVNHIDTFNWNPSVMDLALKYKSRDFASFKSAIMQPTGKVMTKIHENLDLTDEQIHQLKSYLTELAINGEEPAKHLVTNRIIFILLILLVILSFVDLTMTRKVKYKYVHFVLLLVSVLFVTKYIAHAAIDLGRSENYQPDQPIKFSHKVHAGQNQTSCLYCHYNAEQSKFAGIPPANVCTNCHILIREGTKSGKFEISKIYHAIDSNMPVEWVKVYNLPDHVYFNHAQHVVAGKIDCLECHGDVASMDQVVQVNDLSMGWCVDCHRKTGVQFNNAFYGDYEQLHKDLKSGKIDKVTVDKIGGIDCMKCHY